MYSPLISEDLIRKLYRLKEATKTPMTRLLDAILRDALEGVDAEIYGQGQTAVCRIQIREGKDVPWLVNGKQKGGDIQQETQEDK